MTSRRHINAGGDVLGKAALPGIEIEKWWGYFAADNGKVNE